MSRATESGALDWLRGVGVAVARHRVATIADLTAARPDDFGPPWVAKPDLALGGKGQRGLVRVCGDDAELEQALSDLRAETSGTAVVIEEYIEGEELYAAVSMDDSARGPLVRLAATGGVGFDAGDAAAVEVGLREGLADHHVARLLAVAGIDDPKLGRALATILEALWRAFVAGEATLLELNPLRWDGSRAVAVGVAVEFDDNARPAARGFQPTELEHDELGRAPTERERLVADADAAEPRRPAVKFFELDGDVALSIVGGGAGLACLDYLSEHGLRPACYADYSPGAGVDKLAAIVEAGLRIPNVRGLIFGAVVVSLVDVTEFAAALIKGIGDAGVDAAALPIVARIAGPNEEAAHALLHERAPAVTVVGRDGTLEDACDRLIDKLRDEVAGHAA